MRLVLVLVLGAGCWVLLLLGAAAAWVLGAVCCDAAARCLRCCAWCSTFSSRTALLLLLLLCLVLVRVVLVLGAGCLVLVLGAVLGFLFCCAATAGLELGEHALRTPFQSGISSSCPAKQADECRHRPVHQLNSTRSC